MPICRLVRAPIMPSIFKCALLLLSCSMARRRTAITAALAFHLDTKVRVRGSVVTPVLPMFTLLPTADIVNATPPTLTEYMTLPVEQYALVPMPLNSTLSRLPGGSESEFELVVPPVRFLWLEVQPVVEAQVTLEESRVIISSKKCRLLGSPFISKVKLNERFEFFATAELTWNDTYTAGLEGGAIAPVIIAAESSRGSGDSISAETYIRVDVDTPMPFRAIPKRVIEKTGDTAMRLSMNFIMRSFLHGLATDYARWAKDPAYRTSRSELAKAVGQIVPIVAPDKIEM